MYFNEKLTLRNTLINQLTTSVDEILQQLDANENGQADKSGQFPQSFSAKLELVFNPQLKIACNPSILLNRDSQ